MPSGSKQAHTNTTDRDNQAHSASTSNEQPANPQLATAKDNAAQAGAKNKGEDPKKPGGKDEKQDHEKAG